VRRIWSWIFDGVWGVERWWNQTEPCVGEGKHRRGAHGGI
jgi:hypothetical protein